MTFTFLVGAIFVLTLTRDEDWAVGRDDDNGRFR